MFLNRVVFSLSVKLIESFWYLYNFVLLVHQIRLLFIYFKTTNKIIVFQRKEYDLKIRFALF